MLFFWNERSFEYLSSYSRLWDDYLIRWLKLFFVFPIYWRLDRINSRKNKIYWLLQVIVWYMLKTVFVWLLLHVLVSTNCMRNKADLVVPQAFLSPHRVSNFFLGNISSFVKWPLMRSCIFFILLNDIADIAECAIFCLYNFLYAWNIVC